HLFAAEKIIGPGGNSCFFRPHAPPESNRLNAPGGDGLRPPASRSKQISVPRNDRYPPPKKRLGKHIRRINLFIRQAETWRAVENVGCCRLRISAPPTRYLLHCRHVRRRPIWPASYPFRKSTKLQI